MGFTSTVIPESTFLMDQNVVKAPPPTDSPAVGQDQAIKQLTERVGAGDGTIFQQLTSNPFFTAVCRHAITLYSTRLQGCRDLALRD